MNDQAHGASELPEAGIELHRVPSPIQVYLERLHANYAELQDGDVARYIPELAKANPEWFGICLATTDGQVYETGDTRQAFTIQSISKPFVYGLALEDVGREAVLKRIGVEPSGEAFNSISLAPGTGCPLNPMINAGAIAATALVAGRSTSDRLYRLFAVLSLYAGRALGIDRAVYESERETGHRNRAIGHMLRNFDVLTDDPASALDLYFQQCSIAVDCRDLSLMAATLANGGVNPLTGERAVRDEFVESILSIMTTCGMYDSAGEWVYSVGLPAKILVDLLLSFADAGKRMLFVGIEGHPRFMRRMEERLSALDRHGVLHTFPDMDHALEWCENRLIAECASEVASGEQPALGTHELCRGLTLEEIATLEGLLQRRRFERGSLIVRKGDSPDTIYLLVSGEVSVTVDLPNGQLKRLATLSGGMAFGEMAVVDRTLR